MADYQEGWDGPPGPGWPARWTPTYQSSPSASVRVQGGAGLIVVPGTGASGSPASALLMRSAPSTPPNIDVQVTVSCDSPGATVYVWGCASGVSLSGGSGFPVMPTRAYGVRLNLPAPGAPGSYRVSLRNNGSTSELPLQSIPAAPVGTVYRVRLSVVVSGIYPTVRAKVWRADVPEPDGGWVGQLLNFPILSGSLAFAAENANASGVTRTFTFDDLNLTPDGIRAAPPMSLSGDGSVTFSVPDEPPKLHLSGSGQVTFSVPRDTPPPYFDVETAGAVTFTTSQVVPSKKTRNRRRTPYLAVEVRADLDDTTFTLDKSELDGDDLLDWADEDESGFGWTNVVCDVRRVDIRRGVTRLQGILTRAETGTLDVELIDFTRRFDPLSGQDTIVRGTPIRVRAWHDGQGWQANDDGQVELVDGYWSEVLITGRIDTIDVRYVKDGPPVVNVAAADVIGELVAYEQLANDAPGVGLGDDLLRRVRRVMDNAGQALAQIAADTDPTYAVRFPPSPLGGSAWALIGEATDAELGRVWADRRNRLVVRARGGELSGRVRGTLSDQHEEITSGVVHCCYREPMARMSSENLINQVRAQRRVWEVPAEGQPEIVAAVAGADDLLSQARHGVRSLSSSVTSLELLRDYDAKEWATAVVAAQGSPEVRVDSLQPAADNHVEAWPQLAATEIGDRWDFIMRPTVGPPIDKTLGVLGLQHSITPDAWVMTLLTVDAPSVSPDNPSGFFTLDLSELDSGDLLPPYAGDESTWVITDVDGGPVRRTAPPSRSFDGGAPRQVLSQPPMDGGRP